MNLSGTYIIEVSMKHVMQKVPRHTVLVSTVIVVYLILHLAILSRHPFVHSDEAWLAVLTRAMMTEHSLAASEEVFRLTPRYPHALKTLYHVLQMPFLAVSWSAFAARLPSLIAGIAALYFLSMIAGECGLNGWRRFIPTVLMAVDPQFWYMTHLGRQEMIIIALFLLSWSLKTRKKTAPLVALPLAAGIFVHPNIFIVAMAIGALYTADILRSFGQKKAWRLPLRNLAFFTAVLGAAAVAGLGTSFLMDSGFLQHYTDFGNRVGAGDSLVMKILGLPRFLGKMWNRRAGTYYLADVRPLFVFGMLGYAVNTVRTLHRKAGRERLLVLPSLLIGMIVVGKYAPPTVTFLMPPLYLAFGEAFFSEWRTKGLYRRHWKRMVLIMTTAVGILLAAISFGEIRESLRQPSYAEYVRFLRGAVKPMNEDERILVNLNAAFAFGYDKLVIWRDLSPPAGNDYAGDRDVETESVRIGERFTDSVIAGGRTGLEGFLDDCGVCWVVLPDELKYIYERRPVWNALYGNPEWYPSLIKLLERRGEETSYGVFPNYAMRIVPYMKSSDWSIGVYHLKE